MPTIYLVTSTSLHVEKQVDINTAFRLVKEVPVCNLLEETRPLRTHQHTQPFSILAEAAICASAPKETLCTVEHERKTWRSRPGITPSTGCRSARCTINPQTN